MVGNYGVPDRTLRDEFGLAKHFESDKIHAAALLVQVGWESRTTLPLCCAAVPICISLSVCLSVTTSVCVCVPTEYTAVHLMVCRKSGVLLSLQLCYAMHAPGRV